MYKKYVFGILVLLLSSNFLFVLDSGAQTQKMITMIVQDTDGNPVIGARITIGESSLPILSNDRGEFIFQCLSRIPVLIEADGFESQLITATPGMDSSAITLSRSLYQMGDNDLVRMPFESFKQRQVPGAVVGINPRELLRYDQQNSFSGALRGRIPGIFGSTNIRQFGSPLIVVDGIPRPASDFNLEQIEQITVIKDLASAMLYGSQAENGVILITTRRGKPLKREYHVTAERGMNIPISYPKYLNSADYMELYNEALSNDGLGPKYSATQIERTREGSDPVRYPDEHYYNSTYLNDWSTYNYVVGEAGGGNEIAQYYLNVGWNRNNSILKLGEGGNEKNDRYNMRGNVDYKLTDNIKITFDGSAIFNFNSAPRYTSASNDFWKLSTTLKPDNTAVLIPASYMKDLDMLNAAKLVDGQYLLGGTSEYQTNIYGELTRNGPRLNNDRLIELRTGLDFDLSNITPGLSASGYLAFDMFSMLQLDILNAYAVYRPNYSADTVRNFTKYKTDVKIKDQTLSSVAFYRRSGVYGKLNYHRIFNNKHNITANAVAYRDQYNEENATQLLKHLQFALRANYTYDNKYIAELTGVYTGSVKLFETKPWALSPGIGFAWILSEEDFLKDNSLINYLKLRTNWAVINTDEGLSSYFLGRELFSASGTFYFNHGPNYNSGRIMAMGNPDIGFEKKMNYNFGFESMLMGYRLGFEGSYFYRFTIDLNENYDVLVRRINQHPVYIITPPFENYGSYRTQGVELGLNYYETLGDFDIRIGSNFAYSVPKALIVDELDYEESYRKLAGRASDSYFGYVALGLFKDQSEIDNSPVQTFGAVQPGDIRYADLNDDGVIDDKDQKVIGNSRARVHLGLHFHLKFRSFELFALGTGQYGRNRYFNDAYYWVYSDRKYSEVVWDRWTPATAETATYPRLTTFSNPNNFRNSTFWIHKYNWFTLHTLQLTYGIPSIRGINDASVFLRAGNLFTFSKVSKQMQLNVGSSPQMRVLSLGLNISL